MQIAFVTVGTCFIAHNFSGVVGKGFRLLWFRTPARERTVFVIGILAFWFGTRFTTIDIDEIHGEQCVTFDGVGPDSTCPQKKIRNRATKESYPPDRRCQ